MGRLASDSDVDSNRVPPAIAQEDPVMTTETKPPQTEEFRITGEELLAKVRELVHEGNIRRVIIRNEAGTTLVEIPLTVGLVGVALLPVWAAVGAIAALATDCSIVVERHD
jgi:Domain of unknown function (DUF4342)